MTLLLARHGEPENRNPDASLTSKGFCQVASSAQQLIERELVPTEIISSDVTRAFKTSRAYQDVFAEAADGTLSIETFKALRDNASFDDYKAAAERLAMMQGIVMAVSHEPVILSILIQLTREFEADIPHGSVAIIEPGKNGERGHIVGMIRPDSDDGAAILAAA